MIIDGHFEQQIQHKLSISNLTCPSCNTGKALCSKHCVECDVFFEAVLVTSDSQAFIMLSPNGDEIPVSILSACLLPTNAIPLPPCPYCGKTIVSFRKDAGNTAKPFCCDVFFPPEIKDTNTIAFSYKPADSPYVEEDELRSLPILAYFQEILKRTGQSDTRIAPTTDTETETRRPQHKQVREKILKYLEERGEPVRKKELIKATGASQQAVTAVCNQLIDEGIIYKIRRGVYGLSAHKR